jgi:integrase
MDTTYDVRIWSIQENARARGKTYVVRWRVAGRRWKATFKTAALADSFRSDLLAAARKGEAFDTGTGRPVSMLRASKGMSWYSFACAFADLKWPRVAATTRRTHAEALTAVTTAMFTSIRGQPNGKLLRAALKRWAFNTARRDDPNCPDDVRSALRWVASHTRPVSALRDPRLLRQVLDGLTVKLDGTPAAPSVTSRRRKILHAALEYAVELELLDKNPMPALKWTPPKTTHGIDRRRVANPIQARTLLHAVDQQRGGRRLVAFFGCLYYAALRPEEAISLAKHNLSLPTRGWGELPTMTIGRVWRRARKAAFTAEVAASPLAKTPYDLRHAAVSTWLNGGVPPTTVAEWVGHSVEILLRMIYAKCLDGSDTLVRRRVQAALGHSAID